MFKPKKILSSLTLIVLLFGWAVMSTVQVASAANGAAITPDGSQINYQGVTYTNSGLTDTNNRQLFISSNFQCGDKVVVADSADNSYTLIGSAGSGGLGNGCTLSTGGEVALSVFKVETQDDCEGMGADWQVTKCTFNDTTDSTTFAASASGAAGNLTEGEGSCEDEGGEFSFFLCPALRIATDMFEELDYQIRSALEVKPKYYQDADLKQAWARIRNVAYVLLIPAMLFMVIGTALGFNFLDAYTVKRSLPRMFAAIIFMALSYDVCRILIEITNGVGRGAGGLIAQPFGGLESLRLQDIFNAGAVNGASALGGGVLGVVALFAIGALSLGILASYFFTASLALLVVFVVLSIRELVIVFLIILSPLAILAWIFPGNDKLWKLWWGTFSKLLFLYPLIVGLLVTGRAFAKIAGTLGATGIEGVFIILVKLTAYVGPFFFIPKAFQYAGSAFGNLAGMVNDRSKGLFDRQRKYRGERRKKLGEDARAGNRFKNAPAHSLRSRLNSRTSDLYNIKNAGIVPSRMGARMRAAQTNQVREEYKHLMDDKVAMSTLANDNAAAAGMAGEGTFEDAVAHLMSDAGGSYNENDAKNIAGEIMQIKQKYGGHAFDAAAVIAMAGSKTSFKGGPAEMFDAILEAAHGDKQLAATLYAQARSAAEGAGRLDLAGYSYGEGLDEATKQWNGQKSAEEVNNLLMDRVIDSKSIGQVLSSHGTSVKNLTARMAARHQRTAGGYTRAQTEYENAEIEASANPNDVAAQERLRTASTNLTVARNAHMAGLARLAAAQDQMPYFSPENQDEFNSRLATISLPDSTGSQRILPPRQEEIHYKVAPNGTRVRVTAEEAEVVRRESYRTGTANPIVTERVLVVDRDRNGNAQGRAMTIQEEIAAARNDPQFNAYHRELGMDQREAQARQQGQIPGVPGP